MCRGLRYPAGVQRTRPFSFAEFLQACKDGETFNRDWERSPMLRAKVAWLLAVPPDADLETFGNKLRLAELIGRDLRFEPESARLYTLGQIIAMIEARCSHRGISDDWHQILLTLSYSFSPKVLSRLDDVFRERTDACDGERASPASSSA